jgi:hypothetical protein
VANLQNNLTREVEDWYAKRQRKLDAFAHVWPVRLAVSRTRDLSTIAGPAEGTTQYHLVCGYRGDSKFLCGQTVYILKLGACIYTSDLATIHQGIARHIGICHMEVIDDG